MPAPQNRKWTLVNRQEIDAFRAKYGLSKNATAKVLGVSPVSLTKWMRGGEPPLESKQQQIREAMDTYAGPVISGRKPVVPPLPPQKRAVESGDDLILQIVLERIKSGEQIADIPGYIQAIKDSLR